MADLFTQPCTNVLVIGVGALGCAVAGRGALNDACELPLQAEWAALHTQSSELFATGLERRLLMALPAGVLHEQVVDSALEARAENWLPWVQGKRLALIAADESDGAAAALALRLAARIQSSGAEALLLFAAGGGERIESGEIAQLRVAMETTDLELRPSALEAARVARVLESVEALVAALRAAAGGCAGAREPLDAVLRWNRLETACGCARDVSELARAVESLEIRAEAALLLVHGASERSVAELARLREALCAEASLEAGAAAVRSVEGRAVEEGLFWMLFTRRPRPGNIVALNTARRDTTSAACART